MKFGILSSFFFFCSGGDGSAVTPVSVRFSNSSRGRKLDSSVIPGEVDASHELVRSVSEIKSMVQLLCDKNEQCLKELQQSCSRYFYLYHIALYFQGA